MTSDGTNRSPEKILAEMLECAQSPVNKTWIMYNANLSYAQLKKYMVVLQQKNLIKEQDGKWIITEKGREFMKACDVMMRLVGTGAPGIEAQIGKS